MHKTIYLKTVDMQAENLGSSPSYDTSLLTLLRSQLL